MDDKILWDIIDGLRDEINIASDGIADLNDVIKDLQAENKRLNRVNAELSDKLQAVNDDYNNDHNVHNVYEDGLLAEIKVLKADNVRLVKQVGTLSHSNSTHTIAKEIDEYMSHNDKCNGARLFIIPIEEFDADECCHKWFTWDEGVE